MRTMQKKILDQVEQVIRRAKLEPVTSSEWANTGTVYAMRGLTTVASFHYQFNDTYLSVSKPTPEDKWDAANRWAYVKYGEGDELQAFIEALWTAMTGRQARRGLIDEQVPSG